MNIGMGIALLLFGLILILRVVTVDLPWVDDYRLGVLLTILGVVAIALVVRAEAVRRRSTQVIEREERPL